MDQNKFRSELSQDVMRKKQRNFAKKQMKALSIVTLFLIVVIIVCWFVFGKNPGLSYCILSIFVLYFLFKIKIENYFPFGKIPEPTEDEMKEAAQDMLNKLPKELLDLDSKKQLLDEKGQDAEIFLKANV